MVVEGTNLSYAYSVILLLDYLNKIECKISFVCMYAETQVKIVVW